jgi:hypothetical protein
MLQLLLPVLKIAIILGVNRGALHRLILPRSGADPNSIQAAFVFQTLSVTIAT